MHMMIMYQFILSGDVKKIITMLGAELTSKQIIKTSKKSHKLRRSLENQYKPEIEFNNVEYVIVIDNRKHKQFITYFIKIYEYTET